MDTTQFTISADKSLLDIAYVHANLSRSYWAEGIPLETVQKSIDGAMCFGVYKGQQQVGFARLITDQATFGYLADVFVEENMRGQGIGKMLMQHIMGLDFMPTLRSTLLGTRDAHSLYAQFGFAPLKIPERFMQIARPGIYLLPKK